MLRGSRSEYRDALYQEYQVAVETDGRIAHPAEARWADTHRDNAAAADGIITLRYGWSDVTTRPCFVAAEVGAVLAQRGWPGPVRSCGADCTIRSRGRPAEQPLLAALPYYGRCGGDIAPGSSAIKERGLFRGGLLGFPGAATATGPLARRHARPGQFLGER